MADSELRIVGSPLSSRWSRSKAILRFRIYVAFIASDLFALAFGLAGASLVRFRTAAAEAAVALFIGGAPLYLLIAFLVHAYSISIMRDRWGGIGRALRALAASASAIMLIAFLMKAGADLSRLTLILGMIFSATFMLIFRYWLQRSAERLIGGTPFDEVTILDGPQGLPIPTGGCTIYVDADDAFDLNQRTPVMYDRLARAIRHADRVIVHCPIERRRLWANALRGMQVQAEVVAPELQDLTPLGLARHWDTPTFIISRGPLGLANRFLKRTLDLAVSTVALIVLGPVALAVALAILILDGRPIFFVQHRIGLNNQLFAMWKFRTMRNDAGDKAGDRSTARCDERITPLGRFLRMTSIDELPQILNVFHGEMSIVGPRPHAVGSKAEDLLFWHIDERYWNRHAIKPGLTGLAQVRGFRGATHHRSDVLNRLHSDLEYVEGWTVWRDMLIIVRTATVLFHRNAF